MSLELLFKSLSLSYKQRVDFKSGLQSVINLYKIYFKKGRLILLYKSYFTKGDYSTRNEIDSCYDDMTCPMGRLLLVSHDYGVNSNSLI